MAENFFQVLGLVLLKPKESTLYRNTHAYAPTESVNRQHPVTNLEINVYKLQYYNTVEMKFKGKY